MSKEPDGTKDGGPLLLQRLSASVPGAFVGKLSQHDGVTQQLVGSLGESQDTSIGGRWISNQLLLLEHVVWRLPESNRKHDENQVVDHNDSHQSAVADSGAHQVTSNSSKDASEDKGSVGRVVLTPHKLLHVVASKG